MAVSKEQKAAYKDREKPYKACIEDLAKEASVVKSSMKKNPKLAPYGQLHLAVTAIQMANTQVQMSKLSMAIQNLKNDTFLNDARKEISNSLNDLLKLTGSDLDTTLTENKEKLKIVELWTPKQRVNLLKAFRTALDTTSEALGANNKWRWSFPELHFKLTSLAYNSLDFKEYEKSKDTTETYHRDRRDHMKFLLDQAQYAAQEYRSKFELSTKDASDLSPIVKLFEMLKKVYGFLGQRDDVEKTSVQLDSTREKIESLLGKKEKKKA